MEQLKLSKRAAKVAAQVDEVASAVQGDPGSVLISIRVNLRGLVSATASSVLGTSLPVGSKKLDESSDEVSNAGFPGDDQQAFGLTEDSILVVSRSQLSGRPKEFRCALPLSSFRAAEFEKARLGDIVRFTMTTGAQVEFVCVKVDPGETFIAELNSRLA